MRDSIDEEPSTQVKYKDSESKLKLMDDIDRQFEDDYVSDDNTLVSASKMFSHLVEFDNSHKKQKAFSRIGQKNTSERHLENI